jgi:hypothetical protein
MYKSGGEASFTYLFYHEAPQAVAYVDNGTLHFLNYMLSWSGKEEK